MRARLLAAALGAAALLSPLPARAEPGDELTVSVLTFGPGDHPFFKFGHNAILVQDRLRRSDRVYNFGTFSFDSPALIPTFLKGKLRYWLSIQSLRGTIEAYKRENRTIDAQELDLTPALRRRIVDALDENAKPENRYYKYDYYRDNCSTRVRDAVDLVTDGKVHDASRGPARMTWRAHTLRLVADDWPIYLGLHAAMGDLIDRPIDVWQEMFLPSRLSDTLREVKIPGPDGQPIPLVKAERRLLDANRAPVRTEPPHRLVPLLAAGSALGAGLAALGARAAQGSRAARVGLGAASSLIGLVLGLLGLIFVMFWTYTDHEVAHHNENILQCAPWAIVLVGMGINLARGKTPSLLRATRVAQAALVASVAGLAFKVLPWFRQDNAQIIALLLPLWAGLAWGLRKAQGDLRKEPAAS